jgi:DNA-binding XRE family transcriptional regulator
MKISTPEHLAKMIKKIRAYNNITQEELAVTINITRSMILHI